MRRTICMLFFCISLEVLTGFGVFSQLAFASAHATTTYAVATTHQKEMYQQSNTSEQINFAVGQSNKARAESNDQHERNAQPSLKRFWPSINIPNFFSLWQQQPGKQKQKDVADLGE